MANSKSDHDAEQRAPTQISPTIGLVNRQIYSAGPRWAIIGIFFILLFGALYLTASFVLPVIIALLFALVMSPIVRFLRRRLKIPEPFSALALVVGALATLVLGFYMLSGPVATIVGDMPRYVRAVDVQLRSVQAQFSEIQEARERVSETANGDGSEGDDPDEVVVQNPGLVDSATNQVPTVAASVGFALVFLFFLLASGDLFYQKLVRAMPTFSDKKRAMSIAHRIERDLSRYLLTITVINIGLGIGVGTGLWWVNMPTPVVLGALATLLNFIPYIGSLVGIAIVAVIALAEFGSLTQALVPALIYLACTSLEGQFVTPTVVGRRLEMNAAAVFLSVAFWGWIWGVVGMFLAVPVMVCFKVLASHVEPMSAFGDFLSAEPKATTGERE